MSVAEKSVGRANWLIDVESSAMVVSGALCGSSSAQVRSSMLADEEG